MWLDCRLRVQSSSYVPAAVGHRWYRSGRAGSAAAPTHPGWRKEGHFDFVRRKQQQNVFMDSLDLHISGSISWLWNALAGIRSFIAWELEGRGKIQTT